MVWLTPGFYQHPQYVVRQLLNQMKHDFEEANEQLIRDKTLTQEIEFLFDLRYSVYSQICEIVLKHKPGAPMALSHDGGEVPDVALTLSESLVAMLGFIKTQFTK